MLCFLLFLWLDHCYLLLLLACRTNQWDFVLSCHCMANLHLCIFVCVRTDRFDWRGQRVSVGLAPADREDVHGLDIHDALWQRLWHTWRWVDSGGKAGVRKLSHIYKLLFFSLPHLHSGTQQESLTLNPHCTHTLTHKRMYLPVGATAGVLWPVWPEPHTPQPVGEGSLPPATCPWQSLCSAMSEHTHTRGGERGLILHSEQGSNLR